MTSFRAFVAVDVECGPHLQEAIAELKAYGKALKPVSPANVHVTLKFLGEIYERTVPDIEAVMRHAVTGVLPFQLRLVDVGVFPNERSPRVVGWEWRGPNRWSRWPPHWRRAASRWVSPGRVGRSVPT